MESDNEDKQLALVNLLKKYPVVLSTSQLPHIREKKKEALVLIAAKLECSVEQALKRINNSKDRLKKHMDANKTGNKKIVLKEWMKVMAELMDVKSSPSISSLKEGLEIGVGKFTVPDPATSSQQSGDLAVSPGTFDEDSQDLGDGELEIATYTPTPGTSSGKTLSVNPKPATKKRKASEALEAAETEETKYLTTAQLHRLLMLEQLKLVRSKLEKQSTSSISKYQRVMDFEEY